MAREGLILEDLILGVRWSQAMIHKKLKVFEGTLRMICCKARGYRNNSCKTLVTVCTVTPTFCAQQPSPHAFWGAKARHEDTVFDFHCLCLIIISKGHPVTIWLKIFLTSQIQFWVLGAWGHGPWDSADRKWALSSACISVMCFFVSNAVI